MKPVRGIFIERVNRFVVKVKIGGKTFPAYLPNPGRLWELLIEGREVLLGIAKRGKFPYILLGCIKNGHPVLLHTHLTNKIVKELIEEKKIPFLKPYRVLKEEVKLNASRFDFLLQNELSGEKLLLEVKTCTLFGKNVAMFPDAVTERGKRHLYELSEAGRHGYKGACLFVVMNPDVKFFLPAYHIDFEFSKAFMELRKKVNLWAISIKSKEDLSEFEMVRELDIPYHIIEREAQNKGAYFLILEIPYDRKIKTGGLGNIYFRKGFYVYVGSARRNLLQRTERHLKKRKKLRWHIDYLTGEAKNLKTILIRTSKDLECEMAEKLSYIADDKIHKFGAGDCGCPSHLFYFSHNPLKNENFINILYYFMLDRII
jgi:sugar fermentation stimulation protein A